MIIHIFNAREFGYSSIIACGGSWQREKDMLIASRASDGANRGMKSSVDICRLR